jgi:hypothetical protein
MNQLSLRRLALLFILGTILLSMVIAVGCSKRVTGTQKANQRPVAYFVNIPPDGSQSSANPIVYWVGSDPDGLVRWFRYIVVKDSALGAQTPAEYARFLDTVTMASWVFRGGDTLRVNDSVPNTQTSATVKLSADISDPVNTYVSQYIFLQAIDDQGLGSNVVYRLLKRNDNAPTTSITLLNYDEKASPFINSVTSGGVISGVRFRIDATDPDYPVNPPPFSYEWKLFGPYTYDSLTGGEYKQMLALVMDTVFVSNDAKVYHFGKGEYIVFYCDSIDSVNDSVVRVPCDTMFIDTIQRDNLYGHIKSYANIDEPAFTSNATLYRPVDSSNGWVSSAYDTVYNVYRNASSDVTIQRRFFLWARCKDDANVADLTPASVPCAVIEPKYERDILIVDFDLGSNATINPPISARVGGLLKDTAYLYWRDMLKSWSSDAIVLDTGLDYYKINKHGDEIDLARFLQHKVVILFGDDVVNAGYYSLGGAMSDAAAKTLKAIDAGVNVWFCMRAGFGGNEASSPTFFRPDGVFQTFIGVDSARYTGWLFYANILEPELPSQRIEDFNGAYGLQAGWPDTLHVDTANLHRRYKWIADYNGTPNLAWSPLTPALPEVGWAFRGKKTEPLYLYKSMYTPNGHPLGRSFTYDGAPVAHRTETNYYRTVFFAFTPLSLRDDEAAIVIDSVMTWLFDGVNPGGVPTAERYPNARYRVSLSELRNMDAQVTQQAILNRLAREKAAKGIR